ncbi:hypothetical protein IMZ48_15980 [Candidatus Bathyarchaeota archaeon]|nr:hypothetical protein [Candidatus Bathyarchaeota archaeon]
MIDDLKADSARWEQERRAKSSRNASGGINAPRDSLNMPYSRQSNSPTVQYSHSDTFARRQQGGPSEHNAYGNARDSYDHSQRSPHPGPGPDGPGYNGYPPQPPPGGQYMQPNPQGGYPSGNPGNSGAYPPGGYSGAPKPFSQPDPSFPQGGQQGVPYQSGPGQDNWVHGAARPMASGYREPSQFPSGGMGTRDQMMTTPPSQGSYAPPQHPQPGYAPASGEYYNAQPGAGFQTMPQDPHYGRGGQYQERTTSPPGSKAPDRFATTTTAPAPQTEAYGSMQGQQPTGTAPRRQAGGHR